MSLRRRFLPRLEGEQGYCHTGWLCRSIAVVAVAFPWNESQFIGQDSLNRRSVSQAVGGEMVTRERVCVCVCLCVCTVAAILSGSTCDLKVGRVKRDQLTCRDNPKVVREEFALFVAILCSTRSQRSHLYIMSALTVRCATPISTPSAKCTEPRI